MPSFAAFATFRDRSLPPFDRVFPVALARFVLAFALTSAMTAFVSGDVSRVAAFANLASPARSLARRGR